MFQGYGKTSSTAYSVGLVAVAMAIALVLCSPSHVYAALTDTFELDGNAVTDNVSPGLPDDWDRLYYDSGHSAALWTGIIDDYGAEETTGFAGSKDIQEIEEWSWVSKSITPKNEIENAYAALYSNGHFVFGSDRYRTSGSAQMGFWLLQGDISLNPDGTFNGSHLDGDALILSNFSSGGRVFDIQLYMWDTSRPSGDRLVQVTPLDSTVVYGYVSEAISPSPWPYDPDGGNPNEFQLMSFFEGAADLNALGITGCFTNFLAETRSSASLTAELKDFVLGRFPATPSVTVNSEEICEGETTELCAAVTGGVPPFTYSWTGPGGFTATTECTGPISLAGTYTVTVTGANGCATLPASGVLTVNPVPVCTITGDPAVCFGNTALWCATEAPEGMTYSYSWSGPGGFSSTERCVSVGTAGTYTVTVTDQNGCVSNCSQSLTVYDLPVCSITGTVSDADTVCPCFVDINPEATQEYCGPDGPYTYIWSLEGAAEIIGATDMRCLEVRPMAHCDTSFTLSLVVVDEHGCSSASCQRTIYVVDKTPPEFVYCPPDTVIDCHDLGDVWPAAGIGFVVDGDLGSPEVKDNCDPNPWTTHADKGDRPSNWQRGVDSWGSCGEDTTVLRVWFAGDFCGNIDSSDCVQVISIQDTIPPRLVTPPDETVPCGGPVAFGTPSASDSCDPSRLVQIVEEFTDVVPGPGPGEVTHTRCWSAVDSCGNVSPIGCQNIIVQPAPPACSIEGNPAVCQGNTTSWCATEAPLGMTYSYSWSGPAGFSSTDRCVSVGTGGTYTVTITDQYGCQSNCSKTLEVYTLPVCNIARTGGEADTVCPCFPEFNPDAIQEYCGPEGTYTYSWSIEGGATIISQADTRCVQVQPMAHCDTLYTLTLVVVDENGCSSASCQTSAYVVDKTAPEIVYCPPDTVIDCHDLGDVWPVNPGSMAMDLEAPTGSDNCDPNPWVSHADKGDRPANWQQGVDSWGSCGQDTTLLRKYYVADFCGNIDSTDCIRAITIQDTIPPRLVVPADDVVPCGTEVVFGEPTATDSCDPVRLVEIIIESTEIVPGPGPGELTHTRCWTATDSCGNLSPTSCQTIVVEACPSDFCTYSQGGWGADCPPDQRGDSLSTQPGCIRDYYFSRVFPSGVSIGDPAGLDGGPIYAAHWTSASKVNRFLAATGEKGTLTSDVINPKTTSAGVLAGQVLALRMNVGFSCDPTIYDDLGSSDPVGCFSMYEIPNSCSTVFEGMTVGEFLAVADLTVAGDEEVLNSYGVTLGDINTVATCLNLQFDNCSIIAGDGGNDRPITEGEGTPGSEEGPASSPIPARFAVGQSYPNPFNPSAKISFALPSDGRVLIEVYDIVGRKVITLMDGHKPAGYHSVVWYGKDIQGRPVASGVYFCRVQFGDEADVQKMILLR